MFEVWKWLWASGAVQNYIGMVPHPGLPLPFSLFFKAELYQRDMDAGHYATSYKQWRKTEKI